MEAEDNHVNDGCPQIDLTALVKEIGNTLPPQSIEHIVAAFTQKNSNEQIVTKRRQYGSYSVIALIVLSVSVLAYMGAIDGSAAAGILGAAIGHIFSKTNNG